MKLLLLLSALLSALTGVSAGPQRVSVAAEQASVARTVAATAVRGAHQAVRAVAAIAADARTSAMPVIRFTTTTIPAYASRRRE